MKLLQRLGARAPARRRAISPEAEAAARARRARDHLEKKRSRERSRRERERRRVDAQPDALRGALSPLLFGLALGLGSAASGPALELLVMRSTPLEQVAVQGAKKLSPAQIARDAGLVAGMSLGQIDPVALRDAVSAEPWIESSRTLRLPSGTVVISVVERDAIARWHVDDASAVALVDDDGTPFADEHALDEALPMVRGGGAGSPLPDEAIALLSEVRRHPSLAADPRALTLHLPEPAPDPTRDGAADEGHAANETGYVLQLGVDGPRAVLGRSLLSQRIARLAALLESGESSLEGARWIDLRYADRAVLRTEPVPG